VSDVGEYIAKPKLINLAYDIHHSICPRWVPLVSYD
jgi:hypothetical protein